jgi:hypothetical protein
MPIMRLLVCCIVLAVMFASECSAATRAYVMNGLFVGTGLAQIGERLRARGNIVTIGSYARAGEYAADACAHPRDRIVVIGHSFGATAAAEVATRAAACGARDVTMIGIDPASGGASVHGARAVNFVGEYGNAISGALNIRVPGATHMGILESPAFQARVLSLAP